MSLRQRGVGMLVVVLLLLTVAAFAVIVAASQSGGDVYGSDANADALQALFLAESGIERQLKRFATGTACGSLGDNPATGPVESTHTITDLSTIGLGNTAYAITLVNGVQNDFAGAALPATQCRVDVTGTVLARNISRTVRAIIDRNLLGAVTGAPVPAFNPAFNNPTTGATPSGWTAINPVDAFAANGGPDGTAPNCSRSAWIARDRPNPAGNDRRATATLPVQFTLTAGSVTTISFDRRIFDRASDCGALPGAGPASLPAACAAANDSTVCFQLVGLNTTPAAQTWTVASNLASPAGPGGAACPTTFNPCSTSYPAKTSLNVTMTNAASVSQFVYYLQLQNLGRKEMFVDDIEATNSTAIGAAHVRAWRDCSTTLVPANCN